MKKLIKNPLLIMALALVLIVGSSVGAARAAIVYQTNQDKVSFSLAEVSVALIEGDEIVEDTTTTENGKTVYNYGLDFGLASAENFCVGKKYEEKLKVVNNSSAEYGYDEYVRVIITKSWFDTESNKKATYLEPELIELNVLENNGWILDEKSSTREQTVYYLDAPLGQGKEVVLTDSLLISDKVTEKVTKDKLTGDITTTYDYNGMSFYIDVEVDAVQTHNAKDAIKGAWGVDVEIADDGSLSLK